LIIRECVIFDTQNKFYLRCCHVPFSEKQSMLLENK
jgi:hypothetical protein